MAKFKKGDNDAPRNSKKRHGNGNAAFKGPSPDVGKATQFKVGNPGGPGRPATAKFADAARWLSAQVGVRDKTNALRLAESCLQRAMNGSAKHAELFLNYAEGRPRQGVDVEVGGAMRFTTMTHAEIDARIAELLKKYQQEKKK
jgi:hypothetical protein